MGKGEIARHDQFLLFPQCFQKACIPGASKGVIVRERVKLVLNNVFKLAKGSFNNIIQDSFNKILSHKLTHDRSYMYIFVV